MTTRNYYTCDETQGQANVVQCIPDGEDGYVIELDATLFHPQGGGQPSDSGTIDGVPVQRVFADGETVWHRTATPVAPGPVTLSVDGELRHLHARWHSAGHLIGYAGETFGWQPVKAHHWPGEGRITFSGNGTLTAEMLTAKISAWMEENLPRYIGFSEGKRHVRFGELPAYGCGGTHVSALREIGHITLTNVKMKKGQLVVSYTVDER
ncbi:alanyl-tRNA editing protein [Phytobacter diazotrophicus]|uniref:alanyl-tRNA editing protein n=1 Tax=Phytobacter diazotrophicus TaxID=395631 RepID=UPI0014522433|nr:alanyl-tRNA editing protein [Phytobacter diazotrophicus]QJF19446.1 alanyl-tRNA editing protein [Phytobacter diazotrophicus]